MSLNILEARRETTGAPGTFAGAASGFATKTCYIPAISFEVDPSVEMLMRDDEMRQQNEPLLFNVEQINPVWNLETRMYPDSLAFLLQGISAPVTTAGDGIITDLGGVAIPAGATRHDFSPPYSAGALPRTLAFRACYKEEGQFYELRGCTVETLEIDTPDTGGCRVKASGKLMYINPIADPSLTGTYESLAISPFLRAYATLAGGDLASAAKVEDAVFNFNSLTDPDHTYGGGSVWPDILEYGEGVPVWSGSIQRRRMSSADWNALIAATRFTLLAGYIHPNFITGAYPYKVFVSGPTSAAYTDGKFDALTNSRRTGASYNFKLTRDAAPSSKIQVVNNVASYA